MSIYEETWPKNKQFKVSGEGEPSRYITVSGRVPQFGTEQGPLLSLGDFNRHLRVSGAVSLRLAYAALARYCGQKEVVESGPHEDANISTIQRDALVGVSGALGKTTLLIAANWEIPGHGISDEAKAQPGSSKAIINAAYPEHEAVAAELAHYDSVDPDSWLVRYTRHHLNQIRVVLGAAAGYSIQDMENAVYGPRTQVPAENYPVTVAS